MSRNGTSKMNRLCFFLQETEDTTVVRTLQALWEHREAVRLHFGYDEKVPGAEARLNKLIRRLGGGDARSEPSPQPPAQTDTVAYERL
jgi:hypothetical protein